MIVKEIINILKETSIFSDLDESQLSTLAFSADKISFTTGDLIIKQGKKSLNVLSLPKVKRLFRKNLAQ